MGTFAEWVMVRFNPGLDIEQVLRAAGMRPRGSQQGWAIARTDNADAVELTARLATEANAPALGGWVYDSDFAYLVGNDADGRAFEVLLGDPYETDGDTELEHLSSPQGRLESAQALSTWSESNAANAIGVQTALRIIQADRVFVEEGLSELFDELELPDLATVFDRL